MKANLIKINHQVSKSITGYILDYYKNDRIVPYLKKTTLDFIKNCRYSTDDIRPLLTKLGYEIAGGERESKFILPAMAAVHLLLLGFIPIDDIIDGLERQRNFSLQNLPEKLSSAYGLSTKLKEDSRIIFQKNYSHILLYEKIAHIQSSCLERLDASHSLEVNYHVKKPFADYSLKDYISLIDEATSILIAESFVIGGLIAGINEEGEEKMRSFGLELGRLCQIRDDFLDYIDAKITGKLPFADLFSKRKRFPILTIFWFGREDQKRKIKKILGKNELSKNDIQAVIDLILENKIRKKTEKVIKNIRNEALKKMKLLPQRRPSIVILEDLVSLFALE